jgi:mannose-6-phosphate isomerase-like protein (cupin superfamily)
MIDKRTAEQYSWGDGCHGWHLVQTAALSVIEERMPPGTSEVRHHHQKANQFFYVLRGVLSIEVDGNESVLSPGQGLYVPAGDVHNVRNRASADAEFLVVSNPPSHGDRVSAD